LTIFEVLLSETARRQLSEIPPNDRAKVKDKLRELKTEPYRSGPKTDIKKLKGPKKSYCRLRVGQYRAIYIIEGETVLVAKILLRSKAYDWIE
jgi:mRNA-degrading endonuclease RelE of RelBE toxin-antitoxin system